MSDPTNLDRAKWAKAALTTFCKEVDGDDADKLYKDHIEAFGRFDLTQSTPFEDEIADLIKDLMHLAHIAGGVDIPSMLEHARQCFENERNEF